MTWCIVCGRKYAKRYSALCSNCEIKQNKNSWGAVEKTDKVIPKVDREIKSSFWKWAFSPIQIRHNYRGVGISNPFPNILIPIVLPLMFIAILPVLIFMTPFWLYSKIEELFSNK